MPLDVFHFHNGVVHQDTHYQGQRQQTDDIDGKTQVPHAHKRRNDRQRKGHGRHEGGTQIAQEQPDHQHRQHCTFVQQHQGCLVFLFHRCHKVKRGVDLDVRVVGTQFGERFLHSCTHFNFTGATAAGDLKTHHGFAIQVSGRTLLGDGVGHLCDVAQSNAPALTDRQLQVGQFSRRADRRQGPHGLLAATQVGAPTSAFALHLFELTRHISSRNTQSLHAHRVQGNGHFTFHTANTSDCSHTFDRQQTTRHGLIHEPAQTLRVQIGGRNGEGQHWCARKVEFAHRRLQHVSRQVAPNAIDRRTYFIQGFLHRFFDAKFSGDQHRAVLHLGVNVFQSLHRNHGVFNLAGHLGFHLSGRSTWQSS